MCDWIAVSYSRAVNREVTDVKEEEHVIKGPEESRSPGPARSSVPLREASLPPSAAGSRLGRSKRLRPTARPCHLAATGGTALALLGLQPAF